MYSLMNSNSKDYIVALFLVSGVMSCLLFTSAYSQSASNTSGAIIKVQAAILHLKVSEVHKN